MTVTSMLANTKSALVAVSPFDTLEYVAALMEKNQVGAVVVLSTLGQLEGIIVERDILRAIDLRISTLMPHQAKDVMMRRPPTCGLEDSEAMLMERMVQSGIHYLPIVDGGMVIGLVSIGDLVRTRLEKIRNLMQEIASAAEDEKRLRLFTRHLGRLSS